ncbi:MAG: cysteine dioxygenase family protein [Roseovarius sp.]|uniref:cysteine dioxygenase family protein n=1 Tax=Roseovarius sp. TaxID=1486281 RepID=UPI0032EB4493
MTDTTQQRTRLVDTLRRTARDRIAAQGTTRETIGAIAQDLQEIAAQTELWSEDRFPPPDEDSKQARYLIAEDHDHTFALYLNVMRPGKRIPPHNHTTWACVAAVEGTELNTLWTRTDDGTMPGRATVEKGQDITIEPGNAIGMLPDDIHSVFIPGDSVIRHLHFYGRALETLSERVMFDPEAGTCWTMDVGVQTRKAGK